jgi:RNA polymerase sigma factor (sigma-70 family)
VRQVQSTELKTQAPTRDRGAERDLVLAARDGREGRDRLVAAFLPLIGSVARGYRGARAVERRELMQEGVVGLLRALERYDPDQGTPFWAYASWWVRQAMQQVVSELSRPVVLSDRAARHLARVERAQLHHVRVHHRSATSSELAATTGLPQTQVERLAVAGRSARGLEEPCDGAADTGLTLLETIADPDADRAYEPVEAWLPVDMLPELLGELNRRECTVIRARYGLDGPEQTLREVGLSLGLSAERVRQIEREALVKLGQAAWARASRRKAMR